MTARQKRLWVVGSVAVAVIVLAAALVTIFYPGSAGTAAPGCLNTNVAGPVGSVTINACGARAVAICRTAERRNDPQSPGVLAACRKDHINF